MAKNQQSLIILMNYKFQNYRGGSPSFRWRGKTGGLRVSSTNFHCPYIHEFSSTGKHRGNKSIPVPLPTQHYSRVDRADRNITNAFYASVFHAPLQEPYSPISDATSSSFSLLRLINMIFRPLAANLNETHLRYILINLKVWSIPMKQSPSW